MVRVLVVDDEKEIRKGLVAQIPWSEWGVDEVMDADDGDTALALAQRCRPDLIITDIRMPRMSGLKLIEALARDRYDGSLIVISGFDDFHYAKEAFKLGVSDYLLKPISKDELFKSVTVSLQRRREAHDQELNRSMIRQGYESAIPKIKEELIRELISRPYRESPGSRIEHKLKQLQLDWLIEAPLGLAIFGIDSLKALTAESSASDKEALLAAVGGIVEETIEARMPGRHTMFRSSQDEWIALFEIAGDAAAETAALSDEVMERVARKLQIRINNGMAQGPGGLRSLHELHRQAQQSMLYMKVHGASDAEEAEENELRERFEYQLSDPKALVEILKFGTESDIREAMAGFGKLVKSWQVHQPKDMQQRTFEWLLDVYRTAQKTAGWKETSWEKNPIALWEHLERFDTLESLQQQVTDRLLAASESMKLQFVSRSQVVHEAQSIIQRRFKENLTLQMVAEQVHVTPVWLSKLFKKETDMNFLEYLTETRMREAAELLADLHYKVYQISYLVGYQDPVHFSRLFKRVFGCTPQEYRNSRSNQHE